MHLEVSLTAKVPREKAYKAYTDFESMPKWWTPLASVKVTKREGDTVHLDIEGVSGGRRRNVPRTVQLSPPCLVESESETRFTKTKRSVMFEEVPEGTRITAKLDVKVRGAWARVLTTRDSDETESSALEELAAFTNYVEGLPG
ncbi:MAG TPA: SRPBCC family protein [Nitrososphaerales archaeon]|nr:SRPBCC family protein [Nitrososphaerales archaeon]